MKASFFALGLLGFAPFAEARHESLELIIGSAPVSLPLSSSSSADEDEDASEVSSEQSSTAAWALYNVTGDALDFAEDYVDNPGIGNTTAGSYLRDLIADTKPLKSAASRLAGLLDREAPQADIDKELKIIAARYADIRSGHQKASTQLLLQGKASESYQIRTAYTKIRSRWVYLQGLLD